MSVMEAPRKSLRPQSAKLRAVGTETPPPKPIPQNIDAEKVLLGTIMSNNDAFAGASAILSGEHFYDPLHGRIYETIRLLIDDGKPASAVTVKTYFEDCEPITPDLTVPQYLGSLLAMADRPAYASGYAEEIVKLATRRAIIVLAEDAALAAYEGDVDCPPAEQVARIELRITKIREADGTGFKIEAAPYQCVAPEDIPARPIIYGHEIAGQVGATVGRPGVGKTKLIVVENLAKASGRKLLNATPTTMLKCWCCFLEEAQDDLDRLIAAAMKYHGLSQRDIGDRLFINSRNQKLIVATHTREGLVVATPVVKEMKAFIRRHAIDCLTIDPFVKSHSAPENDNGVIDQVAGVYSEIAHETGCHIELYHHTRKTGGAAITIDDVRGGSAIVGAVRSVRILNAMSEDDAARAGVENPWSYIRVDDGKQNNLPPSKARWFRLQSVLLAHGDDAGVATPWEWPDTLSDITASDLLAVQKAVDAGSFRASSQAKDWVGVPIAHVLGLDLERRADKQRVNGLVKTWCANGALVVVSGTDEKRVARPFIEVGTWATE